MTIKFHSQSYFCPPEKKLLQPHLKHLKIITFSHKNLGLNEIGKLVLPEHEVEQKLQNIKQHFAIPELFYVATCNRVEFIFVLDEKPNQQFVNELIHELQFADMCPFSRQALISRCMVYEGSEALEHLLRMSCSLESLVIGEKEILAQVRNAYDSCKTFGLTGDYLRLVVDRVVKTAKEVYTNTDISKNPISVVSLAHRRLESIKKYNETGSRILIIGAGETNQNFVQYLRKHPLSEYYIFNRTLEKAESLAKSLNGVAFPLSELENFDKGFDIIITCTSATEPIITKEVYSKLLQGDNTKKIIVDLAVPNDTDAAVVKEFPVTFINVQDLEKEAEQNRQKRLQEISNAEEIIFENIQEFLSVLRQRKLEVALKDVPNKIKEIKHNALEVVFAKEINLMQDSDKETLNRVLNYVEKKYISIPMIMAKDILLEEVNNLKK